MPTVTRSRPRSRLHDDQPRYPSLLKKFKKLFPPLVVIIEEPSGKRRKVKIPDPRAGFAACYEADGDGGTCHKPKQKQFNYPKPMYQVVLIGKDGSEELHSSPRDRQGALEVGGMMMGGSTKVEIREVAGVVFTGRKLSNIAAARAHVRTMSEWFERVKGKPGFRDAEKILEQSKDRLKAEIRKARKPRKRHQLRVVA